jgi:DNA-binding CsgD family transcriptional regulator
MKREGVSALSAQQRECLRLVAEHRSSKDIAKVLGTSPHTVDNHIKAAIQRLGVSNRREASRIYAENEHAGSNRELASQLSAMETRSKSGQPHHCLPKRCVWKPEREGLMPVTWATASVRQLSARKARFDFQFPGTGGMKITCPVLNGRFGQFC